MFPKLIIVYVLIPGLLILLTTLVTSLPLRAVIVYLLFPILLLTGVILQVLRERSRS